MVEPAHPERHNRATGGPRDGVRFADHSQDDGRQRMLPSPAGLPSSPLPTAGLPLTAFEEYMFLDDRPSHPMLIVARFDFEGGPPPPGLDEAFAATLRHEPLLGARIAAPRRGRPRWLTADPPVLEWATADDGQASRSAAPAIPRIDPRTGPMLHARVLSAADGWSLVVTVHHAACDGLGLAGFMERWLLRAGGGAEPRAQGEKRGLAALRGRGRVAASWKEFARMLPKLAKGLEGVTQFLGREVAALGTAAPRLESAATAPPDACWRPAVITATLDADAVGRLDARAARQGVRVNDLLLGALLAAVGAKFTGGAGDREPWIRLAVPLSLRTKSDYALPAVNRVSMVFLDRRAADRLDEARLLRGLRDEMQLILDHRLGHIFPLSLEAGRWGPGGLARVTRRPKPQSTAVLSNLGRCFHRSPLAGPDGIVRLGTSRLTGWWMVPPVRPGTAVAIATHETHGQRTIAFHVDESRVPLDEAGRMLDAMRTTLQGPADDRADAHPPLSAAMP